LVVGMGQTEGVPAFDAIFWLPWTAALSAIGLVAAWRAWRRHDRAAVARRTGYALVPWAALLLGLYGLVWRVGSAVTVWTARFVFDPFAWLGIVTALVSTALIVVGRRLGGRRSRAQAPAITKGASPGAGEFGEVEAILRKHGIT